MLAVFTVDSIADDGPGSLRDAIEQANVSEESDEILFDAGVFATPQTIAIDSALPTITRPLSIFGPGADLLSIDARHGADGVAGTSDGWHVFYIANNEMNSFIEVELAGLTIRNADASAIYNLENLSVSNSEFFDNYGDEGGAIRNRGLLKIIEAGFTGNHASDGGAIYNGFNSTYVFADLNITESSFLNNHATHLGGALYSKHSTVVEHTLFKENSANLSGGAIFAGPIGQGPLLRLIDSAVIGNQAQFGGGVYYSSAEIVGSTFSGNRAEQGAAIFIRNLIDYDYPIRHSTIVQNTVLDSYLFSREGASVFTLNTHSLSPFSLIENSIVAETQDENGEPVPDIDGNFDLSYSLVGFWEADAANQLDDTGGNIIGRSRFNRVSPRIAPLALNGGLLPTHALLPESKALDAGDPSIGPQMGEFDQRGGPYVRVIDSGHGVRLDMGAYEAQGPPTASPGDFNRDGHVDAADYTVWRDNFGAIVSPLSGADADGDGVVNELDAQIWRSHYGEQYIAYPLVVNNLGDEDDGDLDNGVTTLREAINAANDNAEIDLITFDPFLSGGTIFVGSSLPNFGRGSNYTILSDLTIDARMLDEGITLDGTDRTRIFFVDGWQEEAFRSHIGIDLTLAGLTMAHGSGRGGPIPSDGGVIYADSTGDLTLIESTIRDSQAFGTGGGIYSLGPVSLFDSFIENTIASSFEGGGGIYSLSPVTLTRSKIIGTSAHFGGGISTWAFNGGSHSEFVQDRSVTLIDSAIINASSGIYTDSDVTLIRSRVDDNQGVGVTSIGLDFETWEGEEFLEFHLGKVTLIDSSVSGNVNSGGGSTNGGGISAMRDVSLLRSHVDNNSVAQGNGGGIATEGTVRITDSTVSGNSAEQGGGIYAEGFDRRGRSIAPEELTIAVINSEVNDNTSVLGGGGLHSLGSISVSDSEVSRNHITGAPDRYESASAVYLEDYTDDTFIRIVDSVVSHNQGPQSESTFDSFPAVLAENFKVDILRSEITANIGGGVEARSVIDSTISRNEGIGVSGAVSIIGSTISENSNGGVYSHDRVTIVDSVIRDNTKSNFTEPLPGPRGGGLPGGAGINAGSARLLRTLVEGNETFGNGIRWGGGIYISGSLLTVDSTIRDNASYGNGTHGGGIYTGGAYLYETTVSGNATYGDLAEGGGIYSRGGVFAIQSTLSGNRTLGAGSHGGAISTLFIDAKQTTITDNHAEAADANGGGVYSRDNSSQLEGTILAGNSAGGDGNDWFLFGTATSTANYSLIGDTTGSGIDASTGTGNRLNVDPRLGPLADNGGPTLTHALMPGSPALDAGDSVIDLDTLLPGSTWIEDYTPIAGFDARLAPFARIADGGSGADLGGGIGRIDIGAYEAQGTPLGMPGDYNRDGTVGVADFTLWRIGEGAVVSPLTGADGNGDGVVGLADYRTWRTHYGHSLVPSVAAAVLIPTLGTAENAFLPLKPLVVDEAFATDREQLLLASHLGDVIDRDDDREQPLQEEKTDAADETAGDSLAIAFASLAE